MSNRGKPITILVLSIVVIALFTGIVSAATYTLFGRVTNQSGSPLEAVSVEVLDPGTGTVMASAATDATGNYALTIDEGTYDIRVVPPAGGSVANNSTHLKVDRGIQIEASGLHG